MRFASLCTASTGELELNAMHTALSEDWIKHFENRLRRREQELRGELQAETAKAADERFTRVASEVPDPEDAALADVVIDSNQAEIGRDLEELRSTQEALGRITSG